MLVCGTWGEPQFLAVSEEAAPDHKDSIGQEAAPKDSIGQDTLQVAGGRSMPPTWSDNEHGHRAHEDVDGMDSPGRPHGPDLAEWRVGRLMALGRGTSLSSGSESVCGQGRLEGTAACCSP